MAPIAIPAPGRLPKWAEVLLERNVPSGRTGDEIGALLPSYLTRPRLARQ